MNKNQLGRLRAEVSKIRGIIKEDTHGCSTIKEATDALAQAVDRELRQEIWEEYQQDTLSHPIEHVEKKQPPPQGREDY